MSELSIGAGGKKNRQKERRLMKGFNIAPQPSSGGLPPVSELIMSSQEGDDHYHRPYSHHQSLNNSRQHEIPSNTLGGIFGPSSNRRNLTSINGTTGNSHAFSLQTQSRESRNNSQKRKWGTLIEAARSGKVSRLIGMFSDTFSYTAIIER